MSNLASLCFRVNAATERRKNTQVDFLWITRRYRTIAAFSTRLDASVFTPMLPAAQRRSRTCATRATDVISERKHCSRRRRCTQVELSSPHKNAGKTQTIARKCGHGARKRKRRNVRSTCGWLKQFQSFFTTMFFHHRQSTSKELLFIYHTGSRLFGTSIIHLAILECLSTARYN